MPTSLFRVLNTGHVFPLKIYTHALTDTQYTHTHTHTHTRTHTQSDTLPQHTRTRTHTHTHTHMLSTSLHAVYNVQSQCIFTLKQQQQQYSVITFSLCFNQKQTGYTSHKKWRKSLQCTHLTSFFKMFTYWSVKCRHKPEVEEGVVIFKWILVIQL